MLITADFNGLMSQAPETAAFYLRQARQSIDAEFGTGFAAKHPELVAAFMQTAMSDFCTATRAKVFESSMDEVGARIGQIADALGDPSTGSISDTLYMLFEKLGGEE